MQSSCSSLCSWLRCFWRCTAWDHASTSTLPSTALTAVSVVRLPPDIFVSPKIQLPVLSKLAASALSSLPPYLSVLNLLCLCLFLSVSLRHKCYRSLMCACVSLSKIPFEYYVTAGDRWQHLWSSVGFLQAWHFLWHQCPACSPSAEDLQDHQVSAAAFRTLCHLLRCFMIFARDIWLLTERWQ